MLASAYRCFAAQDAADLEWIVLDDSPTPSAFLTALDDPRVRYRHLTDPMSVGEKRNTAIDMAAGEIIVQFDDDDYYAPTYIRSMLDAMRSANADIVKLAGFFLYSKAYRKFGYCDLRQNSGFHFHWSNEPMQAMNLRAGDPAFADSVLWYGFSYIFKKQVWRKHKFPQLSFNEDTPFIKAAVGSGARLALADDDCGLCLHILHEFNSSTCYPQYTLPEAIVRKLFPRTTVIPKM